MLLLAVDAAAASLAWGQSVRHDKFSADNPRPLLLILASLEEKYGWTATYEDPPWEYAGDLADETDADFAARFPGRRRLFPRGGRFEFSFDVLDNARPAQKEGLEDLLRAYNSYGFPEVFSLDHSTHRSHFEPSKVRKADGQWVPVHSILAARVSFPRAKRSTYESVSMLLGQVAEANHVSVGLGTIPMSTFRQTQGEQGAENEVARDVLLRILEDVNRRSVELAGQISTTVWYLAYDPGSRAYFFSAHVAAMEVNGPSGSKIRKAV